MTRAATVRARLALLAGIAAAFASCSLGWAANAAGADFGVWIVYNSCCTLYGSRADITAPNSDFVLGTNSLGLMRVTSIGTASGIQIGFGQTYGITMDNCGSRTTLVNYWEYQGTDGLYRCGWPSWQLYYGGTERYSVFRSTTVNSTTWAADIDGIKWVEVDLGMTSAARVSAGGELNDPAGDTTIRGTVYGCYGCNGNLGWQRATVAGGTSWYTVQSGNVSNTDFAWHISALPSPFSISHNLDLT